MGLTIVSYPVYDGLASLENVYVNIRDLETTKYTDNNSEYMYKFQFFINYSINDKQVNTNFISKESKTPYTGNLWDLAYTEVKAKLDAENLTHSDNI